MILLLQYILNSSGLGYNNYRIFSLLLLIWILQYIDFKKAELLTPNLCVVIYILAATIHCAVHLLSVSSALSNSMLQKFSKC